MFQLNKTIVSEEIFEKEFVCNLSACKGACCVDGDAGAPLDEAETKILAEIYPKVKPFLRPEGIKAIEEQGTHVTSDFGELETPLIEGRDCAYVIFDGKTALCGIEQAYYQGIVDWKNQFLVIYILSVLKNILILLPLIIINGIFVQMLVL